MTGRGGKSPRWREVACRSYKSPMGQCLPGVRVSWRARTEREVRVVQHEARKPKTRAEPEKERRGDSPPERGPFFCLVIIGRGLEPQVLVFQRGKGSVVEDELDKVAFDVVEAEGEVTDSRDLELRAGMSERVSCRSMNEMERCPARSSIRLSGLLRGASLAGRVGLGGGRFLETRASGRAWRRQT